PGRMATQPASIRGRRLRVSVVSSRDVSPPRSRWRTSPAARRRHRSEYWVVRSPTSRNSSSYSRLTARVAWRRALQRQGAAAGLDRSLLILNVYAGVRQMSRGGGGRPTRSKPCVEGDRDHARRSHTLSDTPKQAREERFRALRRPSSPSSCPAEPESSS